MRKALLFFSILAVNYSLAQPLQPIPYENSGWSYVGWIIGGSGFPEEEDLYRCYFAGDTNLNSLPYNKLYYDVIRYFDPDIYDTLGSQVYIGGMRNDGTLYYFLDKDSTEEVLVYDLSKTNIGDSLPTGIFFGIDYLIIEDTSVQIMEDGSIRHKFTLDFQNGPGVNAPYKFYEGIGYSNGIIPHELFEIQYYNGGVDFQSFCLNGNLVYRVYEATLDPALECDFTVGTKELTFENELVKIFPNPVVNGRQVNIELDQTFATGKPIVTIYNSFGQKMSSKKLAISTKEQALDVSLLKPGIYYLQFSTCDDQFSSKLILQ